MKMVGRTWPVIPLTREPEAERTQFQGHVGKQTIFQVTHLNQNKKHRRYWRCRALSFPTQAHTQHVGEWWLLFISFMSGIIPCDVPSRATKRKWH